MTGGDDRATGAGDSARGRPWWEAVADEIEGDALDAAPLADPWADRGAEPVGLTDEQRAFLAALEDQPPVPRFSSDGDHDRAGDHLDPARGGTETG